MWNNLPTIILTFFTKLLIKLWWMHKICITCWGNSTLYIPVAQNSKITHKNNYCMQPNFLLLFCFIFWFIAKVSNWVLYLVLKFQLDILKHSRDMAYFLTFCDIRLYSVQHCRSDSNMYCNVLHSVSDRKWQMTTIPIIKNV